MKKKNEKAEPLDIATSLLDYAKRREEVGMAITGRWIAMWQDSLSYFLSHQLKGRKKSKKWDWVVVNYLWPSVMQEMAKLARNFEFIATPGDSSDSEAAEAFQGFLHWQWRKKGGLHPNTMRIEQLKAILDGKLHGYRVSKLYWEEKVRFNRKVFPPRWEGQVRHRLWPPQQFWASDKEYINDGDCGTVRYIELSYAKSLWSDYKSSLEENSVSFIEAQRGTGDTIRGRTAANATYGTSSATGGIDRGVYQGQGSSQLLDLVLSSFADEGVAGEREDDLRYCRISEEYLKDPREEHKKEVIPQDPDILEKQGLIRPGDNGTFVDTEGNPIEDFDTQFPSDEIEWDEPLFENGRYIIRNEDTILNPDEEDQKYPHSVWPFIVTPHYLLPHMWQGSDAFSLYKDTQDHINVTVSHLLNNNREFGDPRIAVESGALDPVRNRMEKPFSIMRGAGAIIRLARGGLSRLKIIPPTPIGAGNLALYQLFVQEFKNIQGLQDIARGKKTEGEMTATQSQFLAISSNDRIKLQNIFEEQWAFELGSLLAEMDQYYYEADRIIRVIGEDNVMGAYQITQHVKEAEFDIDLEPTECMPFDEEKTIIKYEKAYGLLNNPVPNPMLPDMLRVLKIKAWQKILKKHQIWQDWVAYEKLIMAVQNGEIKPEDAVGMLIQNAKQRIMAQGENNGNRSTVSA